MNGGLKAFAFTVFLALPAAARAEESAPPPEFAPAIVKDLCNYLKDVEAKTDEVCASERLIALRKQDVAGFEQKLAQAQKRKSDVQTAYEILRALPPDGAAPTRTGDSAAQPGPDPLHLEPPINERTFPVWIGAQAQDFMAVYSRWLKEQNAEFERERQGPLDEARKKEIAAKLAQNQAKLSRLEKMKEPAELSCFLGENCGRRGGILVPSVAATGVVRAWSADDYSRANAQARVQNRAPGGKLDRGIPAIAAGEVIDNSPLGPLSDQPLNGGSPVRTAAELALVATGGLLLFGGFGGKQLEEKFPGIRRNMGIAALVGSVLATGGLAWESHIARIAAAASPLAANPAVEEEASDTLSVADPVVNRASQVGEIPNSVTQGARLKAHLDQLRRFGQDGFEELENGAIRYYGKVKPADNPGEMVGMRRVREWNPATGATRTWFETVDGSGGVRIVRPETGGPKVHHFFDQAGNYVGSK